MQVSMDFLLCQQRRMQQEGRLSADWCCLSSSDSCLCDNVGLDYVQMHWLLYEAVSALRHAAVCGVPDVVPPACVMPWRFTAFCTIVLPPLLLEVA